MYQSQGVNIHKHATHFKLKTMFYCIYISFIIYFVLITQNPLKFEVGIPAPERRTEGNKFKTTQYEVRCVGDKRLELSKKAQCFFLHNMLRFWYQRAQLFALPLCLSSSICIQGKDARRHINQICWSCFLLNTCLYSFNISGKETAGY